MGDPTGPELRRREVLESLDRHGVQFVLVGGQAAASHGALRPTRDLDICVLCLLTGEGEPIAVPHRDGRFLIQMDLSTWRSTAGDIDLLRSLPFGADAELRYERLSDDAESVQIDGVQVMVASLDDVITSKETADRPSDREALPELRALRDERRPAIESFIGWPTRADMPTRCRSLLGPRRSVPRSWLLGTCVP